MKPLTRLIAASASLGILGLFLGLTGALLAEATGAPFWEYVALVALVLCFGAVAVAGIAAVWALARGEDT